MKYGMQTIEVGNRKNAFDTFCNVAKYFLQLQRCHWHQHFWNGSVVNMYHSYRMEWVL